MTDDELHDKISGILFGTAIGDALGLMAEGMSAEKIARRKKFSVETIWSKRTRCRQLL